MDWLIPTEFESNDAYVENPERMNRPICSPAGSFQVGAWENPSGQYRLASGAGPQILLVQHRPIELSAMEQMLGALGYRVTKARDSGKALLYFGRTRCDLVISELDMPVLNGFQLARRIRMHAVHTRILLMTARCQAEVVDIMDDRVVDGWLFKPFQLTMLNDMLQCVCSPARRLGAAQK